MNKLLLVSLACLMLLANGDDEVAKKIDASKPTASIGEGSGRTNSHDRLKRMPVTKESDSLGYAWNIGSGVSYMKIHVGKDRLSGEVEGLRAAQHQVEHSLRVDHITDQDKVKADKTTVASPVSALDVKLKNDNYLLGGLDLDKSRKWGNADGGLKVIEAEKWGKGHQKYHFKGLNFETNGFPGDKLKEVKHLDVSLREFGDKENDGKRNFGSYKGNDIPINHISGGGLSTPDSVSKEKILIPSIFSEEESKTRSNYETTEEHPTINGYDVGKSGKYKARNDKQNIGGLGFQGSDVREAYVFNVDHNTGNGRTEHELGRKQILKSSIYGSAPKISEPEQFDFGFKGLNFGEYGFLLENNNKGNGGGAIQYDAEQNPEVGHSSGAEIKQLILNQGEIKLEEKEKNNAYFPTAYYNGYSHGLAQSTQNVKSFHQDKLTFGGTASNSGSLHSQENEDRETGDETKEYYASFDREINENGDAATKYIESNMEKGLADPMGHGGHESNGKQYIHPKIENAYIGVINPTGHLPPYVINFGVNRPFSQKLISEQTRRIKQIQDNSFESASDGQLVGTGIYSILDGNAQSDARDNGYSFQGNSRNTVRNASYHGTEVDSPYGFKIGVIGPNDESMNRDVDEVNSSEVESGNEETNIEGGKKVMNDANLKNNKATSYSYGNVRLGHALGELTEYAPYWKGHEFHHHFENNLNLGERNGFLTESKKNSPIESNDDAVKGKTLWRKQRFSGKFTAKPSPTQFNSANNNTSKDDRLEEVVKVENEEFVNDKKPREDRKGREAKNTDDLYPKVRGKYSNKQSLGNAGVDHLLASSTIAKNTLGDDEDGENNHLEESEEVKQKEGVIEHHERDYSDHFHFSFHKEPEVREITKAIPVHKEIKIPVPQMVHHPIPIPFPVKVLEPFLIKIPFPVAVEKTVQVPVEKLVPYPVEKPVPVKIIKKVPVPVPKPYPVRVPVYKVKYIHHKKKKQQH